MTPLSRLLPLTVLLLLPVAMPGAPIPKDQKGAAVKADLEKLEGMWRVVSYQKNGVERDAELLELMGTVTFKGRDYTWGENETPSGTIDDLDPTATPKRVTYQARKVGDEAPPKEYGIYMLSGDVFIDCFSTTGDEKDRPTEFVSKPKSGVVLVMYKRVRKED